MARRLIVIIVLATTFLPCPAQQTQSKPIDVFRNDLKQPTIDTGKANQILNLALCYVYKPGEIANDPGSAYG